MPRNEDGEYELLLGNRQLLSVFFIVVILLGTAFSMGYIVGRNSTPSTAPAVRPLLEGTAAAQIPAQPGAGAVPSPTGPASAPGSQPPAAPKPPAVTASPGAPAQPAQPPAGKTAVSRPPAPVVGEPVPGETYLQVVAVKRPEAEALGDVLRNRGFRVLIAAHPTEPVYRVLVGPVRDAEALAKTKSDLEAAGFKPIRRSF